MEQQQQMENTGSEQTDAKSTTQPRQNKLFALFKCEKYETNFLEFIHII